MREIAIQLSAPMVRATLDGSKTVTRRTVKGEIPNGAVRSIEFQRANDRPVWRWLDAADNPLGKPFRCPYGMAGDILWGREAWRASLAFELTKPSEITPGTPLLYVAGGGALPAFNAGKFRPGMFMPRWASRILLEVIDVRVERLQMMGVRDAIAEGIPAGGPENPDGIELRNFRDLWISLNGPGSWTADPFVFAISFRRLEP